TVGAPQPRAGIDAVGDINGAVVVGDDLDPADAEALVSDLVLVVRGDELGSFLAHLERRDVDRVGVDVLDVRLGALHARHGLDVHRLLSLSGAVVADAAEALDIDRAVDAEERGYAGGRRRNPR